MKMAREGRLRKRHRRDWPGFLNRVVPPAVWRKFQGQLQRFSDPRIRWLPKCVLVCWLVIGWSGQRGLTERFREGGQVVARLGAHRRRPGGTYPGLIRATQRIGLILFARFWSCLRETIPSRVNDLWTWYGWIVMAVDGSRQDAPRTRRNQRALGRCGRDKTHPQWWITLLIHLPTRLLWDWRQGPGSSSERTHLRRMIPALPRGTLLVADTGFGGFDLLGQLWRSGVHFLVRCAGNTTLLFEGATQDLVREGGVRYVCLWPKNRRRKRPLKLRLIVLKRRGKRVYLLTNVLETHRLSRPMAGELYQARWGIEVLYRGLKQTLDRRKVLARTPEPGAMEVAGNIVALAMLMLLGARAQGEQMVRLSVAAMLQAIQRAIERVRYGASTGDMVTELRAAVRDDYHRRCSKRARDWPHKKNERPPGSPRWCKMTPHEKKLITQCWSQKQLQLG